MLLFRIKQCSILVWALQLILVDSFIKIHHVMLPCTVENRKTTHKLTQIINIVITMYNYFYFYLSVNAVSRYLYRVHANVIPRHHTVLLKTVCRPKSMNPSTHACNNTRYTYRYIRRQSILTLINEPVSVALQEATSLWCIAVPTS